MAGLLFTVEAAAANKTKLTASVVKVDGQKVTIRVTSNLPVGAYLSVSLDFDFQIYEPGPSGRGKITTVQSCYSSLRDHRVVGPTTTFTVRCDRESVKSAAASWHALDGTRVLKRPKVAVLRVGFYPGWGLERVAHAGAWTKKSFERATKVRY